MTTFNWKLFGVDKFLNIRRSHIPCVNAIDGQLKGPVILSYAVGCLLMNQSCLSLTDHISFCGLTIKIAGSMCVFWSCNLFFLFCFYFCLHMQGTNKVKESMRAEVIDKCKYLLTLTLT